MTKSTVLSINELLNKALMKMKLASMDIRDQDVEENDAQQESLTLKQKMRSYNPMTNCQPHTLHYAMKGVGYLPTPILEKLIDYLKGATSKQYLHANAHMRLILAVNSKLKKPLELTPMHELRERFTADAGAMQAPQVWQQANDTIIGSIKGSTKRNKHLVHWEDKVIANADDGDMTIRCYQSDADSHEESEKNDIHNSDESISGETVSDKTVLLYFHGGGFCLGDINTHHEFCHAICAQTGWPIVSVDYRLAPEYPSPTALRDCISAYHWLVEHCHTLGALPSRIVLAGDSAGGGLSTLIAQQLTTSSKAAWSDLGIAGQRMFDLLATLPKPLAQMLLYPVTDIETDYPSWELYGKGLLLDHADVAVFDAACLDHSPLPRQHILNCPMLGDNSKVCPTYIVAAELDVLRDEAFAYAEQLKAYGIPVETRTILGAPHGFIHFMSIHQVIGQETSNIIDDFSHFVRNIINTPA